MKWVSFWLEDKTGQRQPVAFKQHMPLNLSRPQLLYIKWGPRHKHFGALLLYELSKKRMQK